MPGGRPTDYQPEFVEEAKDLASAGAIDTEIADSLGIDISTFYKWRNRYPEFREAIKVGKADADQRIVRSLYQKAYSGDSVAMIFWLKNRMRDEWKDRNTLEGSNDAPLSITFKSILDKE